MLLAWMPSPMNNLKNLPGWKYGAGKKTIETRIRCKDFLSAIRLMGRIAKLAETADHHPDFHLTNYRKLTIELSTHAIGGLSENDFILAAKIDAILV